MNVPAHLTGNRIMETTTRKTERIAMPNKSKVVLAKSHRKPAPGARLVGDVNQTNTLEITIRVRPRTSDDPAKLLADMQNQPPAQRKYLTREDLATRFGADPGDMEKVAAYARENGLTITNTSVPRRTLMVQGTIANLVKAFPTELKQYDSDHGKYRGRIGPLHIPSDLSGIIEAIFGFDDRRQARPHSIVRVNKSTSKTASKSATTTAHTSTEKIASKSAVTNAGIIRPFRAEEVDTSFTPPQIAALYDFPQTTGANQCIGIIEFGGGYDTNDLQTYFTELGIAMPQIATVSVDGVANNPNSTNPDDNDADGEVMLDIEVAGAVAPAAKFVVYFAPFTEQGWVDVLTTAVQDTTNKPSVLSISWGWPESNDLWTQQAMDAVSQTLQQAGLAGITVCCASGDDGSADELTDGHAHVDFPAASPYILACGGTTLSASSDKKTIASEVAWNKGPRSQGGGATGGGVSEITPVPTWQAQANVPPSVNTGFQGRGVPDVSGDADADTGYKVRVHGQDGVAGGTSAVAPLYAALIALETQQLGAPLGFINPLLYANPASGTFNDITQGSNDTTGNLGGYPAGTGWDACTGLGSPDGAKMFNALQSQPTQAPAPPATQQIARAAKSGTRR
jgi:kumamolisin